MGPVNLPSSLPRDASQLYAANITAFLKLLAPKGELVMNREDQIIRDTLVTHGGEVVNSRVRGSARPGSGGDGDEGIRIRTLDFHAGGVSRLSADSGCFAACCTRR